MSKKNGAAATAEELGDAPLAVVADHEDPEDVTHVAIGPDRWVHFDKTLTGEDFLVLYELAELQANADAESILRLYGPIMSMIKRHCLEHNLDEKPILDRDLRQMLTIWKAWNDVVNNAALDPTIASG